MFEEYALEQPIIYKIIENQITNDKLSHAYLIDANGYSKSLDFSVALANNILSKTNNIEQKDNILELKIIEAEGQWIKKNQLEELQLDFSKKAILGNKRIYIINEAEKLNQSSSNSLLKFLEEPEEGIIAILITNNINQLLDTIISRCQILKLKNIRVDYDSALEYIGNFIFNKEIDIKEYISNDENLNMIEKIIEFIKYYETNKLNTICYLNKMFHQYFKERKEIYIAFNIVLLFYVDVFNKKLERKIQVFVNNVNDIDLIVEKNNINTIISKINVIMNLKEKIKFNANSNLLLDKLLIGLEGCEYND